MTLPCYDLVRMVFLLNDVLTNPIDNSQKREWISQSSALSVFLALGKAILTSMELSMVSISLMFRKFYLVCISGWGATGGAQKASTDRLQETVVPIVQSSICVERMNQTGDVNEDLIVCAGGKGAGPCKV